MLINTHRISHQNPKPSTLTLAQAPVSQGNPGDSVTLSGDKKETLQNITGTLTLAGGVAGSVGAGVYAAGLMPSGMGGISGAITGAITGAVAGTAAGYGLAVVSTAISPSDRAGDAMTTGLFSFGGMLVGGVAGAVGGYFGAQPLVVAPAAVVGGTASTFALSLASEAIVGR